MADSQIAEPPSRSNAWLAVAAAAGAIALSAWGLTRDADSAAADGATCSAAAEIDLIWTATTSTEIRAAFVETGLAYAATVSTSVERDIDAYVTDWKSARRSVCEAGERSTGPATVACLHRQREQLAAFIDVLRDPSAAAVTRAAVSTQWLPPLEDCGPAATVRNVPADARSLDVLSAQIALGQGERAAAQLASRVDDSGDGPDPRRARALLLGGLVHAQAGQPTEATPMLEQAVWAAIESGHDTWAVDATLALSQASARADGDFATAQRWWRLGSALTTKMGPGLERQRRLLLTQADLLGLQGQWAAALAVYEPALSLTQKRYGAEHPAMIEGLAAAAEAAARVGRAPESMSLYDRARKITVSTLGHNHPLHRGLAQRHGLILLEMQRPDLARPELEASLETLADEVTESDVEVALAIGRAAAAQGEPGEAERAFDRAQKLHAKASLPASRLLPSIHLGRGLVHLERSDPRSALDSFRAALAIELASAGPDSVEVAQTSVRIGRALARLGRMEEAGEVLEGAASIAMKVYGEADPRTAEIWLAQSEVSADAGDPQTALALARRALGVLAEARGPSDVGTLVALTQVGSTCLALGRDEDAVTAFGQAVAVAKSDGTPGQLASAQLGLATALWKHGERERALEVVGELRSTVRGSGANSPVTPSDVDSWMKRRGVSM